MPRTLKKSFNGKYTANYATAPAKQRKEMDALLTADNSSQGMALSYGKISGSLVLLQEDLMKILPSLSKTKVAPNKRSMDSLKKTVTEARKGLKALTKKIAVVGGAIDELARRGENSPDARHLDVYYVSVRTVFTLVTRSMIDMEKTLDRGADVVVLGKDLQKAVKKIATKTPKPPKRGA